MGVIIYEHCKVIYSTSDFNEKILFNFISAGKDLVLQFYNERVTKIVIDSIIFSVLSIPNDIIIVFIDDYSLDLFELYKTYLDKENNFELPKFIKFLEYYTNETTSNE